MASTTHPWMALAALSLLLGCTESGTLRVDGQLARNSSALVSSDGDRLELGEGSLVIERARIAVSEIEFEGGRDEEREAELGGAVIDLALNGHLTTVAADEVEAGSYHTVGLELRSGGPSIMVEGARDGVRFAFESRMSPELEFPLDPEVVVPPNGEASVGVMFDVAAWFTSSDGTLLSPADGTQQATIENRIRSSMAAHVAIEDEDDD